MAGKYSGFDALGKRAVASAPKIRRGASAPPPTSSYGAGGNYGDVAKSEAGLRSGSGTYGRGGYSGAPNVATGSGASPMSKKAAPSTTPSGPVYLGSAVNHTGNVRDGLTFRQYTDAAHPGMVIHEYTINGERHRIAVPKSQMRHF